MPFHGFLEKLYMWYHESHGEVCVVVHSVDESYAIYPRRFYGALDLKSERTTDFVFIGGLHTDVPTYTNRKWIVPFIKRHFTDTSYLQFTDSNTKSDHEPMGTFDFTLRRDGLVPKETPVHLRNRFDADYFANLSRSKFCLCPAGDQEWSMRFYEALMCKCIPIVLKREETYRSREESELDYRYYLASDPEFIYREDWVEHNYMLFMRYHTLSSPLGPPVQTQQV